MLTKYVEINTAQQQLAELIAQAETGTEIILLDAQRPCELGGSAAGR